MNYKLNLCKFDDYNKIKQNNNKDGDITKNEIICIYNKKEDEINLLHDYKLYTRYMNDENRKLYEEGRNNINEKNIDIYINDKKTEFNYKYKSDEKGYIKVKYIFNKILLSTSHMFYDCPSLESINLSSFNTTNINNMRFMFSGCSSLKSIDLSSFNTVNVNNMSWMFSECSSLQTIILSSFDTIHVNDMNSMFSHCSSLKSIDLSSFKTTNVNNMSFMFSYCSSLQSIDLSSFDTTNINNMSYMFKGCSSLLSVDLSSFNITNSINIKGIFAKCSSLKKENIKINNCGKKILDEFN